MTEPIYAQRYRHQAAPARRGGPRPPTPAGTPRAGRWSSPWSGRSTPTSSCAPWAWSPRCATSTSRRSWTPGRDGPDCYVVSWDYGRRRRGGAGRARPAAGRRRRAHRRLGRRRPRRAPRARRRPRRRRPGEPRARRGRLRQAHRRRPRRGVPAAGPAAGHAARRGPLPEPGGGHRPRAVAGLGRLPARARHVPAAHRPPRLRRRRRPRRGPGAAGRRGAAAAAAQPGGAAGAGADRDARPRRRTPARAAPRRSSRPTSSACCARRRCVRPPEKPREQGVDLDRGRRRRRPRRARGRLGARRVRRRRRRPGQGAGRDRHDRGQGRDDARRTPASRPARSRRCRAPTARRAPWSSQSPGGRREGRRGLRRRPRGGGRSPRRRRPRSPCRTWSGARRPAAEAQLTGAGFTVVVSQAESDTRAGRQRDLAGPAGRRDGDAGQHGEHRRLHRAPTPTPTPSTSSSP